MLYKALTFTSYSEAKANVCGLNAAKIKALILFVQKVSIRELIDVFWLDANQLHVFHVTLQ